MTAVPESEKEVGIEAYASSSPPCDARMRSTDDDFQVEELVSLPGAEANLREGAFPLYRVEKRSVDTMHMAREMSRALKGRVSYGGLKDKRACALQYVTPTSRGARRPVAVEGKGFSARLVGFVPRPMSPAAVEGNSFAVVLRECSPGVGAAAGEALSLAEARKLPNYFGLQRFGTGGAGSHKIGKAIVLRRFEEACGLMLTARRRGDGPGAGEARDALAGGEYARGLRLLPPGADVERAVAGRLAERSGDWVGALRGVHLRLRRLYVQAFQSYLFNRTLSVALARGLDISSYVRGDNWGEESGDGLSLGPPRGVKDPAGKGAVPLTQLAGYAFRDYGSRFDSCLDEVMKNEGVAAKEFYVQEMQEVSAEGGFRRPHLVVRGARQEVEGRTATLRFDLARGGYATVLLREVVKPRDPVASGFT